MTTSVDGKKLEHIARLRKFDPRTLEIARRLFIHQEKPKLLSAEYGVILQRIYAIRKAVLDSADDGELTLRGPVRGGKPHVPVADVHDAPRGLGVRRGRSEDCTERSAHAERSDARSDRAQACGAAQ